MPEVMALMCWMQALCPNIRALKLKWTPWSVRTNPNPQIIDAGHKVSSDQSGGVPSEFSEISRTKNNRAVILHWATSR